MVVERLKKRSVRKGAERSMVSIIWEARRMVKGKT